MSLKLECLQSPSLCVYSKLKIHLTKTWEPSSVFAVPVLFFVSPESEPAPITDYKPVLVISPLRLPRAALSLPAIHSQ